MQFNFCSGHVNEVCVCKFLPSGKYCVSGSSDKTVRLWNIHTGKQEWIHFVEGGILAMTVLDSGHVVVGDSMGVVSVIEFNNLNLS